MMSMRFFPSIKKSITSPQFIRQLNIKIPPVPEIVIGNHTLALAALEVIERDGLKHHPNLTFISKPYWMDGVHPTHLMQRWGQNRDSLPRRDRALFAELFPDYPSHEFIRWHHVQALGQEALTRLKQKGIPVFYGEPSIKKLPDDGFEVRVKSQDKFDVVLRASADTQFCVWCSEPRKTIVDGIELMQNYKLYHKNIDYPCIIIYGAGLAAQWTTKIFATADTDTEIVYMVRHADEVREIIPSNSLVDSKRITVLLINETTIEFDPFNSDVMIIHSQKHNKTFRGIACSAIGMQYPEWILKDVPDAQRITPSSLDSSDWIAPKNIRLGSANHSKHKFDTTVKPEWGSAPFWFQQSQHYARQIMKNCPPELGLDLRFERAYTKAVSACENGIPPHEYCDFIVDIYKKEYNPSEHNTKLFETIVRRALSLNPELGADASLDKTTALEEERHAEFVP